MPQTKIQEKFYPLTESIAEALRKAKLSAAEWRIWSYLIVLNPFGDRYEDFDYLSVMSVCECSKTTMWRAFAKFQEFNIFDFQSRGICVRTLTGASQLRKPDPEADPPKSASQTSTKPKPKTKEPPSPPETSDYPEISDPWDDEPISEMKSLFQNCNNDFKNEISISKMKSPFQNCNNEGLQPLSDIQSASPQTIQIKLDPPVQPDRGVAQNNFKDEEVNQSEQVNVNNEELTQNEQIKSKESKAQNENIETNETTLDTRKEKDVPRAVTQDKTEILREPKETPRKNIDKSDATPRRRQAQGNAHQDSELPNDLINWLEELGIPLDEKVLSAIASHDISQAYGACRHVEETWETINNPRGVFLFQLPKQKIEKLGAQLPEIGPKMREEYAAIEEEMASDEYKAKSQEMFAQLRAKLGKKGQKN